MAHDHDHLVAACAQPADRAEQRLPAVVLETVGEQHDASPPAQLSADFVERVGGASEGAGDEIEPTEAVEQLRREQLAGGGLRMAGGVRHRRSAMIGARLPRPSAGTIYRPRCTRNGPAPKPGPGGQEPPILRSSTRRFRARPSSVALLAIGCSDPYPRASSRSARTPCVTR